MRYVTVGSGGSSTEEKNIKSDYTEFRKSVDSTQAESGVAGGGATAVDLVSPDPNESTDSDAVVTTDQGGVAISPTQARPTTTSEEIQQGIENARETMRRGEGAVDNAPAHDSTPTDNPMNHPAQSAANLLDPLQQLVPNSLGKVLAAVFVGILVLGSAGAAAVGGES